jgi:hypothetical protein
MRQFCLSRHLPKPRQSFAYRIMKNPKEGVAIWRLDENRYAVGFDRLIRYVGSQEECQRRADILSTKGDRDMQDRGLVHACYFAH